VNASLERHILVRTTSFEPMSVEIGRSVWSVQAYQERWVKSGLSGTQISYVSIGKQVVLIAVHSTAAFTRDNI
jgi:hypothetical protein